VRLLRLVTAFTIGHSITLVFGAMGWLHLPQQPVEVFIAVTILLTAVHCLRPIFAGKETWVAVLFGFIHGAAFATVLARLQLPAPQMALSIVGFNIGIELMQLFVIALTAPSFIILSSSPIHKWVRIIGASLAIVAAIAWIIARLTANDNFVTLAVEQIAQQAGYIVIALAALAVISKAVRS
jgi:hypothetical protein